MATRSNKTLLHAMEENPSLKLLKTDNNTWMVAQCDDCGARRKLRVTAGKAANPGQFINNLKKAGWQCEHFVLHCPDHTDAKRAKRDADGAAWAEKMVEVEQTKAEPLNHNERHAVRSLLDAHFDDKIGRYLDSYSDQRIAETVGVATFHVTAMREAAYGPIIEKGAEEILREEVAVLQDRMRINRLRMHELIRDMEADHAQVEALATQIKTLIR
jgi:hypothetical protein